MAPSPGTEKATQELFDDLSVLDSSDQGAHRLFSFFGLSGGKGCSTSSTCEGGKETKSGGGGEELRVSVHGASCRIRAVGTRWAEVLGFTPSELVDRSLSLVTGPETDMVAMMEMLRVTKPQKGTAQHVTLHHKCGDGVPVYVAATSVSEGEVLLRIAASESHIAARGAMEPLEATFLADAPYRVCSVSPALRALYQCSDCTLQHEGIACLFGWRTDGTRWKNLVQRSKDGATTSASLLTYQACGNEMQTILTVSPVPQHAERLRLMVELVKSSPADSQADSAPGRLSAVAMEQLLARWGPSSHSTTSSDKSTPEDSPDSELQRASSSESANIDSALSAHIKAMRARRDRKKAERAERAKL